MTNQCEDNELELLRTALSEWFDEDYLASCDLDELQQLYDDLEEETKLDEFLPDELTAFREASITSKKQLLDSIQQCRQDYAREAASEKRFHSQGFYITLDRLLDEFLQKVICTTLPEPLPEWWSYSYAITASGVQLALDHYLWSYHGGSFDCFRDEKLILLEIQAKRLTVSKFAEIYGIQEVTVRQWIRRGKIRSALKMGKEWRIPELAEVSQNRGYVACRYNWKEELTDLPEKYAFLNLFESALFEQDDDNADLYTITLEPRTTEPNPHHLKDEEITAKRVRLLSKYPALTRNEEGALLMNRKDREELELYMISNPLVNCKPRSYESFLMNDHIDEIGNDYCPMFIIITTSEQ